MQLSWRKCADDTWCRLETVVLPDPNASGVVVIWSGESTKHVLYVGRGGLARCLKWARQFQPIAARPNLFVTWANVPEASQPGVWNYLSQQLPALHSDHPLADPPIPVNLPWDELAAASARVPK